MKCAAMVTITAPAKINLTLDILGRRADGYHEVKMIMQTVGLSDTVRLSKRDSGIKLSMDAGDVACDDTNLAWRAAALFMERYGVAGGVAIEIKKRIPVAAGLAGGSTDAAGVLRGMNELYGLARPLEELAELGAAIGSDVPFCVLGGTMLACGRGELLTCLPQVPPLAVVLAKPPEGISTAAAYRAFDAAQNVIHPDTDSAVEAIRRGDGEALAGYCRNVFEAVTLTEHPRIQQIKEIMRANGAIAALMSGSGPTVFALATDAPTAEKIAAALTRATDSQVFITETTGKN